MWRSPEVSWKMCVMEKLCMDFKISFALKHLLIPFVSEPYEGPVYIEVLSGRFIYRVVRVE